MSIKFKVSGAIAQRGEDRLEAQLAVKIDYVSRKLLRGNLSLLKESDQRLSIYGRINYIIFDVIYDI